MYTESCYDRGVFVKQMIKDGRCIITQNQRWWISTKYFIGSYWLFLISDSDIVELLWFMLSSLDASLLQSIKIWIASPYVELPKIQRKINTEMLSLLQNLDIIQNMLQLCRFKKGWSILLIFTVSLSSRVVVLFLDMTYSLSSACFIFFQFVVFIWKECFWSVVPILKRIERQRS